MAKRKFSSLIQTILTNSPPPFSKEKEIEIFQKLRQYPQESPEWIALKNEIVVHYLAFVAKLVNRIIYNPNLISLDDAFQAGVVGLNKAVRNFNPNLGTRFITYCKYWIEKEILASIDEEFYLEPYKIPKYTRQALNRIRNAVDILKKRKSEDRITIEEIAKESRIPSRKVRRILKLARLVSSLNSPRKSNDDDEYKELKEIIPQTLFESQEKLTEKSNLHCILEKLIAEILSQREAKVINLRFFEGKTLNEVGEVLRCSRERVRQIEQTALKKLRMAFLRRYSLHSRLSIKNS